MRRSTKISLGIMAVLLFILIPLGIYGATQGAAQQEISRTNWGITPDPTPSTSSSGTKRGAPEEINIGDLKWSYEGMASGTESRALARRLTSPLPSDETPQAGYEALRTDVLAYLDTPWMRGFAGQVESNLQMIRSSSKECPKDISANLAILSATGEELEEFRQAWQEETVVPFDMDGKNTRYTSMLPLFLQLFTQIYEQQGSGFMRAKSILVAYDFQAPLH